MRDPAENASEKEEGEEEESEEAWLAVQGQKRKFSEIAESDKEKMSEGEYEQYFEVFEKRAK